MEERSDQSLEAAARRPCIHVDVGVVVRKDRGGRARELALHRVDALEDLVPELELDRTPQRGKLAFGCARSHQIVERVEQRLLVEGGECMPVA